MPYYICWLVYLASKREEVVGMMLFVYKQDTLVLHWTERQASSIQSVHKQLGDLSSKAHLPFVLLMQYTMDLAP